MDANGSRLLAGFGLSLLGMTIQILNIAYAIRHVIQRPTAFNIVLLLCLLLFLMSFFPMLYVSLFSFTQLIAGVDWLSDTILTLNRVHNSFYAISTLMYLLLVQVRFRVIKNILPYRDLWDHLFICFTIIIWSGTTLLFGIILFNSVAPKTSLAFSALWTFYALVVDNILSWLFLYNLFKCRTRVSSSIRLKALWTKSVWGLGILCATTWVSLMLLLLAIFKFSEASFDSTRALLYRIAYAFSPIQFSGTLLFIYAVKLLFEDAEIQSSDSELKEKHQKRTTILMEQNQGGMDDLGSPAELDDDCDLMYPSSVSFTSSSESTLYGVTS